MAKIGKKLLAWSLALAMVLTAGDMSVLAQTTGAEESTSEDIIGTVASDESEETAYVVATASDTDTADNETSYDMDTTLTKEEYFNQQLEAALKSYSNSFTLDASYGISNDEYVEMYSNYLYHNYCYFYADPAMYSDSGTSSDCITRGYITYRLDGETLSSDAFDEEGILTEEYQQAIEAELAEIEAVIETVTTVTEGLGSDLEKALYIHDYLALNCEYDLSYTNDTIYDSLVKGSAVCEGYALAFLALAEACGLSCEIVTVDNIGTDSNKNVIGHMWNLVQVDGNWYHVDVTWDDPTAGAASANYGTDVIGRIKHYFFLKSTTYFQSTAQSGSLHQDGDGKDYVYSGSLSDSSASSTTYDDYFWDSVDGAFVYVNGTWYGIERTADSDNEKKINGEIGIYTYNIDGSFTLQETLITVEDYWLLYAGSSSYVVGNFTYLASYDGLLYYNTDDTIYVYDPEDGESQIVYTLSDTEAAAGFIYGFRIDADGNVNYLLVYYSSDVIKRIGVYTAFNVKNYIGDNYELILSETSYTYDGSAKTPTVTVASTTDSSVTLTEGTDYAVSYSDNTNAGTATVIVTGKGDYAGTLTEEFVINKANRTLTLTNTSTGKDITGGSVTMTYAEYLYIQASASAGGGTYSFSSSTSNAGFYEKNASTGACTVQAGAFSGSSVITIKIAETSNYNAASATVTVNCTKYTRTITLSPTSMSLTCGGSTAQISRSITTYSGDSSYTITYKSSNTSVATVSSSGVVTPVGPGSCTITVTVSETDYCAQASASVAVTVGLAKATVSSLTNVTSGITVKWGQVSGATGYYIYRKVSGGSYGLVKTITSGSTVSYTDTEVKSNSGKTYTYYVIPYYKSSSGTITKSSYNNTKSIIRLSSVTVSSLTNATSGITVKWGKVTGANGYYIYRKVSGGSYSLAKTITSGSTVSYTDTAVKSNSGKTYTYYVIPYYKNSSGTITKGSYNNTKSLIRLSSATVSSLTNTSSGITVKWSKVTGANGYYIYRKAGSGSYSLAKTITSGSTVSYTDTAVKSKNGTTYTYYILPYYKNSSGTVTKGSYANTKMTVRLTGVSLSSVTNSSSKKMTVKWAKNSSATGYEIQYSTSSSFASGNKTVTVSGSSSVSKVISSLTKGKTYYVRIRVYKTVSSTKYYSAWSSKKSVKISK